ncbi:MAG: PAS domain-containing sensor histidine kinase [Desulfuromonadales bacterium]|nr:PAS domain-containing sensor histidine kinase [Desulfuromonadales bacterium]
MTPGNSIIQSITLEQALATIPSGLYVVDKKRTIVYWNPAAERITGFSAKEIVGQHCSFLQGIPCGDGCGLYNVEIPKPIIGARCTIVTKSGEKVHLLKNMEYLRDTAGEIIGGIESFTDVTRQHTLEESLHEQTVLLEVRVKERTAELKQSEERFRSVLDNMDDLAYIATEEYVLTFMNRSMLEIFGNRVGDSCYKVLHDEPTTCSWCPMDKVFKHRTVRDERQLGNQARIYEIVHSPLPNENGIRQKLAVCRDITERKKAELDLREANRELDAFAHSISHDLRGILAPVVTYMDFLRLTYSEVFDEQILHILGEVEQQGERAIALLDDLLELAQVGHVKPGDHPTNVNMIVTVIMNELSLENSSYPEVKSEELPQSWLPKALVYQLFTNLLRNACHYAPEGRAPIEVGYWDEDNRVTYFVRDYGPGVPFQERETIFDIFYRGKTSQGKPGNGVGLAIVRKIALRCQGEAWVEQTPGGGATFCVSLPKASVFGKPAEDEP